MEEVVQHELMAEYKQAVRDAEWDLFKARKKKHGPRVDHFSNLVENLHLHGVEGYEKYKETGTYAWAKHDSEQEWSESDDLSEVSPMSTGGDIDVIGRGGCVGQK